MTDQTRISFKNVSKRYRLYGGSGGMLKRFLSRNGGRDYIEFRALEGVSFEVEKGETLGIIGHNGAGKSTLLSVISGISAPSGGSVEVRGKVVSLLELGSGFNPDFTGRENVYIYGSVLGMSRSEIREKFKTIADFADIGDFIEQPARTYSSGMLMRLAFAVATQADADILIFDEVLAVGDARFQHKCFSRLRELQAKGLTLLLVSHNLDTITSLCSRAIILHQGKKYFDGGAKQGFWEYCRLVSAPLEAQPVVPPLARGNGLESQMGTGEARFTQADVLDDLGRPRRAFQAGERCKVLLTFVPDKEIPRGSLGIVVQNQNALTVYGFNTASDPGSSFSWPAGREQHAVIHLDLNLAPGKYFVSVVLSRVEEGRVVSLCGLDSFAELSITERVGVFGVSNLFALFSTQSP